MPPEIVKYKNSNKPTWVEQHPGRPTARHDGLLRLPVSWLKTLPGLRGEHKVLKLNMSKIQNMSEIVVDNAWQRKNPVTLGIQHDGKIFVDDGNHRIRAAVVAGVDSLLCKLKYYGGGEKHFDVSEVLNKYASERIGIDDYDHNWATNKPYSPGEEVVKVPSAYHSKPRKDLLPSDVIPEDFNSLDNRHNPSYVIDKPPFDYREVDAPIINGKDPLHKQIMDSSNPFIDGGPTNLTNRFTPNDFTKVRKQYDSGHTLEGLPFSLNDLRDDLVLVHLATPSNIIEPDVEGLEEMNKVHPTMNSPFNVEDLKEAHKELTSQGIDCRAQLQQIANDWGHEETVDWNAPVDTKDFKEFTTLQKDKDNEMWHSIKNPGCTDGNCQYHAPLTTATLDSFVVSYGLLHKAGLDCATVLGEYINHNFDNPVVSRHVEAWVSNILNTPIIQKASKLNDNTKFALLWFVASAIQQIADGQGISGDGSVDGEPADGEYAGMHDAGLDYGGEHDPNKGDERTVNKGQNDGVGATWEKEAATWLPGDVVKEKPTGVKKIKHILNMLGNIQNTFYTPGIDDVDVPHEKAHVASSNKPCSKCGMPTDSCVCLDDTNISPGYTQDGKQRQNNPVKTKDTNPAAFNPSYGIN